MQHELDVKQRKIGEHMIPQSLYSGHVSCLTCVLRAGKCSTKSASRARQQSSKVSVQSSTIPSVSFGVLLLCVVSFHFSFSKVMFQCTKAIRFSVGILNFCRPMASMAGAVVGI